MITNEREYKSTRKTLAELRRSLEQLGAQAESAEPSIDQIMRGSLRVKIKDLQEEINQYEAVRNRKADTLSVDFRALGDALVLIRNIANMSQADLAERLGIKQQQIQRYEATGYEAASFARLQEAIWALDTNVLLTIELPFAARRSNRDEIHITPSDLISDTAERPRAIVSVPPTDSREATVTMGAAIPATGETDHLKQARVTLVGGAGEQVAAR